MSNILVYKGDGADRETEVFGLTFKAGEAVEVDDTAHFTKLSENPMFRVPDGRSKEARAAKEQAPKSPKAPKHTDDDAKERAAAHKAELEAAEAEKKAEEAKANEAKG